jgi:hypothetical protein
MPADTANVATLPPTSRSRITNGSQVLPGVDGRSERSRRLRDLIETHVSDMGGEAAISEAQRSLARRCSTIEIQLEQLEARFATDGEASARDLDLYGRLSGHLRRMLESLGIERRARPVAASLRERIMARNDG